MFTFVICKKIETAISVGPLEVGPLGAEGFIQFRITPSIYHGTAAEPHQDTATMKDSRTEVQTQ